MPNSFWSDKHVLVSGGGGFLGSRIVKQLESLGPASVFVPRSRDFDLRHDEALARLFDQLPSSDVVVIHAAARVGGIGANVRQPATFFYDNLMMGTKLLHTAWSRGVRKFVAIGTVCAYPETAPVPFQERDLWAGYPEPTNAAYGLAKKMLIVQAAAYRAQYGFSAINVLPTNLYGPGDNFELETSHVIPALIRKCVEAKRQEQASIVAWGTGAATRDFLYVDDAAAGILLAAEHYDDPEPVNLSGPAGELRMRDLVDLIKAAVGITGTVVWDPSQPDGQPRRAVDGRRSHELFGFEPQTSFADGLRSTVDWYEAKS